MKINLLEISNILQKGMRKISLSGIFLVLLPISYYTRFMFDWNFELQSFIWFTISLLVMLYMLIYSKDISKYLYLLLCIDIFAIISIVMNKSHSIFYVGNLIAAQSWGALLYYRRKNLKPLEILSVFFILYSFYRVYSSPRVLISSWQYGRIISKLVRQNTISIFLCEFLSYDLIYRYYSRKKVNYLLFYISIITAVLCEGMGGILSISAFFIGILFINRKKNRINIRKLILFVIILIIVLIATGNIQDVLANVTDDNGRFYIWENYINCIDSIKDFLFGADVSSVPFLVIANNMHNTYMNWHFSYGLIPFIFFAYRNIKGYIHTIINKQGIFFLVMSITFIRSFTDEAEFAFGGIWTFIWLCSLVNSDKINNSCENIKTF